MCHTDQSLFVRHHGCSITIILLYVDDILITGSDSRYIHQLIQALNVRFEMRHLGQLKHFMGIDFIKIDRVSNL